MSRRKVVKRDGISEPKDRGGYIIQWTDFYGRRKRETVKATSREAAERSLAAKKQRVVEERTQNRPLPSEDTFATFAKEFLKHQERRIAAYSAKGHITEAEYTRQKGIVEQHLIPHFGSMKIAFVRKEHVIAYINKRMGDLLNVRIPSPNVTGNTETERFDHAVHKAFGISKEECCAAKQSCWH